MATFAEWKQGFIDNITGGHRMDTKTYLDPYSTVPDILKRHSEAIDRLERDAQISVEVANLISRHLGYYIEVHSVVTGGPTKFDVRLRPVEKPIQFKQDETFDRSKFNANIFDDLRTPNVPTKTDVIKGVAPTRIDRIDKALKTLDKCAAHYSRMLSWVSSNKTGLNSDLFKSGDESPSQSVMRRAIGESWDAASCACCQEYLQGHPATCSSLDKGRCPLSFGDIPHPRQCCSYLYEYIGGARTWKEWEVAAHRVLGYIRAVGDGILFSRSIL